VFKAGSHKTFQCQACRHQTSLIAGTLFQSTKLPLTVWFLAIYLISQAKTSLSALALKQYLGVSYPTARLIKYKLKDAMSEYETTLPSWPPSPSGLAQTPDFGQLKHLDNQESIGSHDGDC
jgi:hypothetical protein